MKKELHCNHFQKEVLRTSIYSYDLVNSELYLCKRCEKKLRKQILEQDKVEKEIGE